MAQKIEEVMTRSPRVLDASATVEEAARCMSTENIGDVIVRDGGTICGIVTDRDITIRVIAEGRKPGTTKLGDICSRDLVTLKPADTVDEAVRCMRERAIRRIPVVQDGEAVGIVSIGDLAIDLDRSSALADVSAAPANH